MIDTKTYNKLQKRLFMTEWKTALCNSGKGCWCRMIVPIDYEEVSDEEQDGYYIISSGAVTKKVAEHIVKVHNEYIKAK